MQKRGTQQTETDDDTFELLGLAALVLVHRLGKNREPKPPASHHWEETRKVARKSGEPDNGAVDLRQFGTVKIKA